MTSRNPNRKKGSPVLGRVVGTLIAVGLFLAIIYGGQGTLPGMGGPGSGVGEPFVLVGEGGARIDSATFGDRLMLIQFGKPRPVANGKPTDAGWLDLMGDVLARLSDDERARVRGVFVGLDAAHDSPDAVAAYARAVHPAIIGVTGSTAEVEKVAKDYRIRITYASNPDGTQGAMTGYDASIYLMGPNARFIAAFPPGASSETIAEAVRKVLPTLPIGSRE